MAWLPPFQLARARARCVTHLFFEAEHDRCVRLRSRAISCCSSSERPNVSYSLNTADPGSIPLPIFLGFRLEHLFGQCEAVVVARLLFLDDVRRRAAPNPSFRDSRSFNVLGDEAGQLVEKWRIVARETGVNEVRGE